jgi:hypothetical protein
MFITAAVCRSGTTMAPATTASAKTSFQSPKPSSITSTEGLRLMRSFQAAVPSRWAVCSAATMSAAEVKYVR